MRNKLQELVCYQEISLMIAPKRIYKHKEKSEPDMILCMLIGNKIARLITHVTIKSRHNNCTVIS